jgi:hypothetical protein
VTRHPNATKGLASFARRQPNFATIGPPSQEHRIRRAGYELRDAAGSVLQACDQLEPLCRYLEEKRDVVVVRVKDGVTVASSPVTEAGGTE